MKGVQCPSCGATATNHLNCEFCGSLFVRYSSLNISTENIISSNGKIQDFVFPGLEEQLRKNISLQVHKSSFIVTDIFWKNENIQQVLSSAGISGVFENGESSFPGLTIHLPFMEDKQGEYSKFLLLEEHKLFFYVYDEQSGCHDYYIDFGNDPTGTAYLVSKILVLVYDIPKDSLLRYETSDYDKGDVEVKGVSHERKGKCFVATATMGDYNHPVVIDLRNFRDNWILQKRWGNGFVNWYYKYGQLIANNIEGRKILKEFCYLTIIKPLHLISKIVMKRS